LRRDKETVKKLKADPDADPYELEFAEAEVEFAELDKLIVFEKEEVSTTESRTVVANVKISLVRMPTR